MGRKYTYEYVVKFFGDLGYILLSKEFISLDHKLHFIDENGYQYYGSFYNIQIGKIPQKVHKFNPYSLKNIKLYLKINNKDYELLSNEYVGNNIKLLFITPQGYLFEQTWADIQSGNGYELFHKSNSYTIHNIKLWLKLNSKLFELIDNQEYKGNNKYLQWRCLKEDCSEIFEATWSNISNSYHNTNCPYCAGQKVGLSNCLAIKRPDLAKEWHSILNGDLTPYDVLYSSTKDIWWKCKEHHKVLNLHLK